MWVLSLWYNLLFCLTLNFFSLKKCSLFIHEWVLQSRIYEKLFLFISVQTSKFKKSQKMSSPNGTPSKRARGTAPGSQTPSRQDPITPSRRLAAARTPTQGTPTRIGKYFLFNQNFSIELLVFLKNCHDFFSLQALKILKLKHRCVWEPTRVLMVLQVFV